MFGVDHSKLTRQEIVRAVYNGLKVQAEGLKAFKTKQPEIERIFKEGPKGEPDGVILKAMVDFTMRAMAIDDLQERLKKKDYRRFDPSHISNQN